MPQKSVEETISTRLRTARNDAGLTAQDAQERIGQAARNILRWETTDVPNQLLILRTMCKVYGVSADYLLGLSEQTDGLLTGKMIVDQDYVQEILDAKDLDELERLHYEGLYAGHEIPLHREIVSFRDYQKLMDSLRKHLESLRGSEQPGDRKSKREKAL